MIGWREQAAQAGNGSEKCPVEAHGQFSWRTLKLYGATIADKYERQMSGAGSGANSMNRRLPRSIKMPPQALPMRMPAAKTSEPPSTT
ncbi:MAG: hypothetical protein OEL78_06500, partial [Hyphomicrobiales bacterium]|nr:hypothetical protein [Hyphomicrobiales bacterium]